MKARLIGEIPGDVGLAGVMLRGATRDQALTITRVAAVFHDVVGRQANDETLRWFRKSFEDLGFREPADYVCRQEGSTIRVHALSRDFMLVCWPFMPCRGNC